ncbi:hypothetical protein HYW76_04480 [Candidatus Pacearchaeota archaeon]|nr:hypothetical protein [Candidatus Pacearchaeota archaeon]
MVKRLKKRKIKKADIEKEIVRKESVPSAIVQKKLGKPLPNKFLVLLVKNHILNNE